jgi:hypothetical protein
MQRSKKIAIRSPRAVDSASKVDDRILVWMALSFAHTYSYKQSCSKMKDYQMAKKSKRRAWTKADIRTLKTLAKKKTRASSIARTLKRTEGATRQKSFSMGLSLDSRV